MPLIYGILAIYGILFFTITLVLAVPTYFLVFNIWPERKAIHVAHKVSRFWASTLLTALFIRLRIKNKALLDPNKKYVAIANHLSQLDVPAYAVACRPAVRFLAKAELGKIPLMGYVIRRTYFLVKREDKSDRVKTMAALQKSLEGGAGLFICPEGTRNRTDAPLLPFKDGAFRLAIQAQVPLAVLVIYNSSKRNSPKIPLSLIPGTIDAEWLEVIETKGMTENDVEALKTRVRKNMEDHILAWRAQHGN